MTLNQPFARTNAFFSSFVPHNISLWNFLTAEQVAIATVASLSSIFNVLMLSLIANETSSLVKSMATLYIYIYIYIYIYYISHTYVCVFWSRRAP